MVRIKPLYLSTIYTTYRGLFDLRINVGFINYDWENTDKIPIINTRLHTAKARSLENRHYLTFIYYFICYDFFLRFTFRLQTKN